MSLSFSASSSDKVDYGNGSSINNLDPFSVLMWIKFNTVTHNTRFWAKDSLSAFPTRYGRINNTTPAAAVQFDVERTSTAQRISVANTITTGSWLFFAFTYDSGGADVDSTINIYKGDLTTPASEVSYYSSAQGTGTTKTDNTVPFQIANLSGVSQSPDADIAVFTYTNTYMSLSEIISWQFRPRNIPNVSKIFSHLGLFGTGNQPDWSGNGNHGTVTGATQSAHVPIPIHRPIPQFFPTMTPRGSGALRFTGRVGTFPSLHNVNHGTLGGLSPTLGTFMLWINVLSQPSAYRDVIGKSPSTRISVGAANNFQVYRGRATISQYATSNDGAWSTGWGFYVGTFDVVSGGPKVYKGTLTTLASDVTNTSVNGSGTVNDDSAADLVVGDFESGYCADMDVAYAAFFNTDLSLVEIQGLQFAPWAWGSHPNCVFASPYGQEGVGTQPDWSLHGYNGTPNVAEVVAGVPIPIFPNRVTWQDLLTTFPFSDDFTGTNYDPWNTAKWTTSVNP